jgi:2-methylcitrate dehydratase PrpD
MLQLSEAETINALGIAEYQSPSLPILKAVADPAMVKHGIGLGALNGLMSAELAARGFTGTPSLLVREEYHKWVGDLGKHYVLPYGMSWKEYSCCMWAHAPLLAVDRLRSQHDFAAADIRRIIIETYPDALQLHVIHPQSTEEAQFSIAWPVAALLVDGEVASEQVADSRTTDPVLRDLAARVEFVASDELQKLYLLSESGEPGGMDAARVTIELGDGRRLESGLVEHPVYDKEAADWDRERMEKKFRWLLRHILAPAVVDQLIEAVWAFEEIDDVRDFARLVSAGSAQ